MMLDRCHRLAALAVSLAVAATPWVLARTAAAETTSPQVQRVYSMLKRAGSDGDSTYFSDSYLLTLTAPQQLEVARHLSAEPSTAYASYGALLLVRLKHADEAVAPTARLLLTGNDVSGLFWSWRNFDDPCLTDSITVQLGTYLLQRYPMLHGAERKRAERYFADLGEPAGKFRIATAQSSLSAIEERLGHRGCAAPSPTTAH